VQLRVAFVVTAAPDTAVTDDAGRAASRWTLGTSAATQTVEARVAGSDAVNKQHRAGQLFDGQSFAGDAHAARLLSRERHILPQREQRSATTGDPGRAEVSHRALGSDSTSERWAASPATGRKKAARHSEE